MDNSANNVLTTANYRNPRSRQYNLEIDRSVQRMMGGGLFIYLILVLYMPHMLTSYSGRQVRESDV